MAGMPLPEVDAELLPLQQEVRVPAPNGPAAACPPALQSVQTIIPDMRAGRPGSDGTRGGRNSRAEQQVALGETRRRARGPRRAAPQVDAALARLGARRLAVPAVVEAATRAELEAQRAALVQGADLEPGAKGERWWRAQAV
jgi:hypothetical protein